MNLHDELEQLRQASAERIPQDALQVMDQATADLIERMENRPRLGPGDSAPDFTLADATGRRIRLSDRATEGPVILTFYRGGWCPYCNLELRAYQRRMPNIRSSGARLLAVSPETPDQSLSTKEKNELEFDVLSDPGLDTAEAYGLAFELPEPLVTVYDGFGIRLPQHNGEDQWRLPVPATFVVDRDLRIELAHFDVDYRRRLEPDDALAAVRRIAAKGH